MMAIRSGKNTTIVLNEEEKALANLANEVNLAELKARLWEAKVREHRARQEWSELKANRSTV